MDKLFFFWCFRFVGIVVICNWGFCVLEVFKEYFYILWNYMIFFLVKELSMIGKIYMMKWMYRIYNKWLNLFYYICICFRENCRIMINIVMKKKLYKYLICMKVNIFNIFVYLILLLNILFCFLDLDFWGLWRGSKY